MRMHKVLGAIEMAILGIFMSIIAFVLDLQLRRVQKSMDEQTAPANGDSAS